LVSPAVAAGTGARFLVSATDSFFDPAITSKGIVELGIGGVEGS
jgi:hypothetical protein